MSSSWIPGDTRPGKLCRVCYHLVCKGRGRGDGMNTVTYIKLEIVSTRAAPAFDNLFIDLY